MINEKIFYPEKSTGVMYKMPGPVTEDAKNIYKVLNLKTKTELISELELKQINHYFIKTESLSEEERHSRTLL